MRLVPNLFSSVLVSLTILVVFQLLLLWSSLLVWQCMFIACFSVLLSFAIAKPYLLKITQHGKSLGIPVLVKCLPGCGVKLGEVALKGQSESEELVNAISHEIRTPLARMRYRLAIMEDAKESEIRQEILGLDRDIQELDSLTEEMLVYARLDEGAPHIRLVNQNFSGLIESVVSDVKCMAVASNTELSCELVEAQCRVEPVILRRVVQNLVINACRYGHGVVRISNKLAKGGLELLIEDNGAGIPEHLRESIFEPFRRMDMSRSRETGGVGLGLAIVKRAMLQHGGSVAIENSELGGAKFRLIFPTSG